MPLGFEAGVKAPYTHRQGESHGQHGKRHFADQVERISVYNAAGDKPGRIDDVLIDKLSGQVRDAVVEFAGFLGRDKDRCLIP